MPLVTFPCPLCADDGAVVVITAELDVSVGRLIVAALSGCPHADRFGFIGQLTLEEERRLIHMALDAAAAPEAHGDDSATEADAGA